LRGQLQLALALHLNAVVRPLYRERPRAYAGRRTAQGRSMREILRCLMVLFLTSIAERFKWHPLRAAILGIAIVMLPFALYHLVTYRVIP
jgi:hypothetical protein